MLASLGALVDKVDEGALEPRWRDAFEMLRTASRAAPSPAGVSAAENSVMAPDMPVQTTVVVRLVPCVTAAPAPDAYPTPPVGEDERMAPVLDTLP